jgi:hypothetical protein
MQYQRPTKHPLEATISVRLISKYRLAGKNGWIRNLLRAEKSKLAQDLFQVVWSTALYWVRLIAYDISARHGAI